MYYPTDLINEYIKKGNPTNSEIISNVILNQKFQYLKKS